MPNSKGFQVRLSEYEKEEIRKLYLNDTMWYKDIINKYKCSHGALWNIIRSIKTIKYKNNVDKIIGRLRALPDRDLGWVAGIVDGEGYIGLEKNGKSLTSRIGVKSTSPVMQSTMYMLTGIGSIEVVRKLRRNRKRQFDWRLWSLQNVYAFLTVVNPLLRVKQKVGSVVLGFCSRHIDNVQDLYTTLDWNDFNEVKRLNRRGSDGYHDPVAESELLQLKSGCAPYERGIRFPETVI